MRSRHNPGVLPHLNHAEGGVARTLSLHQVCKMVAARAREKILETLYRIENHRLLGLEGPFGDIGSGLILQTRSLKS